MNKKKILAIAAVLALVGLVVYLIVNSRRTKNGTGLTETNSGTNTAAIDTAPFPLKKGSIGNEVSQLQKYLIREYGAKISASGLVDGIWGDMTDEAVKTFLKRDNVSEAIYTKFKMAKY